MRKQNNPHPAWHWHVEHTGDLKYLAKCSFSIQRCNIVCMQSICCLSWDEGVLNSNCPCLWKVYVHQFETAGQGFLSKRTRGFWKRRFCFIYKAILGKKEVEFKLNMLKCFPLFVSNICFILKFLFKCWTSMFFSFFPVLKQIFCLLSFVFSFIIPNSLSNPALRHLWWSQT